MFRLAVAGILALAALFAAVVFIPWSVTAGLAPGVRLLLLFALVALVVSLIAIAVAIRAARRAAQLRADILLLARSIDMALKEVVARTDRETATLDDMTNAVSREIDRLSERIAGRDDDAMQAANNSNVVPYPSARRPRSLPPAPDNQPAGADPDAIEAACRKAIAAGEFDIALQPIVSVAHGTAAGFEVFANLPLEGGRRVDLSRPAEPVAPADAAIFERILLTAALQAGRKRLGAAGASTPLHVAVSEAILSSGKELGTVMEILQFYPDLARSLVLSAPVGLLDSSGRHRQALDSFAAMSVRLAAEGWNEAANAGDPTGAAGLSFLKISADRLLDREKARRRLEPASAILDRAAAGNLTIIATGVATDEDAVALIDLGIDLLSGPRFGGPKRFKSDGGGRSGRLALI